MTPKTLFTRAADERGWILVTSMSILAIMLVIAFGAISLVDTQQKRTRQQREGESSLNLAEGVLYAQGFLLAQNWPGTVGRPAPVSCSSGVSAAGCPSAAQVQQNADNVDTRANTTWTTVVRDNGGAMTTAYVPGSANAAQSGTNATGQAYTCAAPCRWDANGDRKMWVSARAIVRGRPRSVVATLMLERLAESTPQAAVTAGGIDTGNSGGQVKIYAVGSNVVVRCDPSRDECVSDPAAIQPQATSGNPPNLMTPSQLERFRQRAIADGKYYATCSDIPAPGGKYDLSGAVVFVDNCTNAAADFSMPTCVDPLPPKPAGGGNGLEGPCINTLAQPGLLIWHCGGLGYGGKGTFIGIMYFANNSDAPTTGPCAGVAPKGSTPSACNSNKHGVDNVFAMTGGFGVWGAIAIDGSGCLLASANGIQVQYDPNVFNAVASYGTVGLVQDTWRELTPG